MSWLPIDTWIVVTGMLTAAACAIPGCFLLLRRLSLMGDALSHAVLPGLAIGFLLTGERTHWGIFLAAILMGVFTAALTEWIHRRGAVEHGAAMGIVFTGLFSLGLVLIAHAGERVDLDPRCVLFGAIELTPLDPGWTLRLGEWALAIPRAALVLAVLTMINAILAIVFFKELRVTVFDPALAATSGMPPAVFHYGLMIVVAVTSVAAFEAVGSILVIAFLIVPAATARLLCDRLAGIILLAVVLGALSAFAGHAIAVFAPPVFGWGGTSSSGMMATMTGVLFAAVAIAHGIQQRRARVAEHPGD